jgi:hypothetical protein
MIRRLRISNSGWGDVIIASHFVFSPVQLESFPKLYSNLSCTTIQSVKNASNLITFPITGLLESPLNVRFSQQAARMQIKITMHQHAISVSLDAARIDSWKYPSEGESEPL